MTKICAVITDLNSSSKIKWIKELGASAVEYRIDFFDEIPKKFSFDPDVVNIVTAKNGAKNEGVYLDALDCGADFVDVEYNSGQENPYPKNRTMSSYHDFEKTPSADEILKIFEVLKKSGLAKAAFTVTGASDLVEIYKASSRLKNLREPFVLIGMGEAGKLTRVRAELLGSEFNYCAFSKKTAEGQLTLVEASNLKNPTVTGITGYPLKHTFSPKIHNAAFACENMSGIYLKIPCKPDELELIPKIMSDYEIDGLNVTTPHKEKIIPYLSSLSKTAKSVGAVNTISKELKGYNTDVCGVAAMLGSAKLGGKKVLLLGAGGAARAAAYYFSKNQPAQNLTISNRTFEKAGALAKEFGAQAEKIENLKPEYDIVLNASAGFVNAEVFSKNSVAGDMNYPTSEFLKKAKLAGCITVSGKTMLIYQAAKSFEIWTGVYPSIEAMTEAFDSQS